MTTEKTYKEARVRLAFITDSLAKLRYRSKYYFGFHPGAKVERSAELLRKKAECMEIISKYEAVNGHNHITRRF